MNSEDTVKDDTYYEQFVIKEYNHWILLVEDKQRYLGQAVAWLKREGDMQRLSSLTKDERADLWEVVLPDYEAAIEELWQPDHLNYAWLGNYFHAHNGHGHMHLIPRYKTPRVFAEREFIDSRWGKNYVPYPQEKLPVEVALSVRATFVSILS